LRVHFLRHGESAHNADPSSTALGTPGGDYLTERGWEQVREAARHVGDLGAERILASPLRRAQETAQALAKTLALPVVEIADLTECSGEETFAGVVARVHRLQGELLALGDASVLAVGHGIFTRFFLMVSVLGEDFVPGHAKRLWQLGSINCGLTVFDFSREGGWKCVSWMGRPWDPP
jgi:probable phosphoglycerate mutase